MRYVELVGIIFAKISTGDFTTGDDPSTTHHYVEADLAMKERAVTRLPEPDINIRRYHAPNSLLEFLKTL